MKKNRGSASILPLIILGLGLLIAVLLVGERTFFKPRASETPPTTSPWGNAARISKSDSPVILYTIPTIPDDVMTFEAWVKTDKYTIPVETRFIFVQSKSDNMGRISLRIDGGTTGTFGAEAGSLSAEGYDKKGGFTGGVVKFTNDTWHHVALVKDGKEMRVYLDGRLADRRPYTGPSKGISAYNLGIGAFAYGGAFSQNWKPIYQLDGEIDEVRVSSNARYTNNFSPQLTPFSTDSNTVALYHLDVVQNCRTAPDGSNPTCDTPDASRDYGSAMVIGNIPFVPSSINYTSPTTHMACVNNACTTVVGIGKDLCQKDADCQKSKNQPPIANFTFTRKSQGSSVSVFVFTNKSSDPDKDPLTYLWNFGDSQTSTLKNPTHTYTYPRQRLNPLKYQVTLRVTDSHGASATSSKQVTITGAGL